MKIEDMCPLCISATLNNYAIDPTHNCKEYYSELEKRKLNTPEMMRAIQMKRLELEDFLKEQK